MKVAIPKKYLKHFQDNFVYVTWQKRPTLLLMNKEENESLQKTLEKGMRIHFADGCEWRPLYIPVVELVIKDGVVDIPIPEDPTRRLRGGKRVFMRGEAGIILS